MKSLWILLLSLIISSNAFSKTKRESFCDEGVALQIINFLEKEEPKADLHLLKNKDGDVIGLTDAADIYPSIDYVDSKIIGKNKQMNIFQYNTTVISAEYLLFAPNGMVSCFTFGINLSQDDQD